MDRVAKCHRYDGYIRVKYWQVGVKFWENTLFYKMKPFLEEICITYVKCLCLNFHDLTESSTFVLQKYPLCQFWCQNDRDLRAFLRVKFGFMVLVRVKRLTFCNSIGRLLKVFNLLLTWTWHNVSFLGFWDANICQLAR